MTDMEMMICDLSGVWIDRCKNLGKKINMMKEYVNIAIYIVSFKVHNMKQKTVLTTGSSEFELS